MNYILKKLSYFLIPIILFSINAIGQEIDEPPSVLLGLTSPGGESTPPGNPIYTPFENVRVNQDNTNEKQVEVSVDVNPRDANNLVAAWIDYRVDGLNPHIAFGYSFDGGQTWVDGLLPQNLGGFPYQGDPAVATDKDGNFYISFISADYSDWTGGVFVVKSTDGGVSWPEQYIRRLDNNSAIDDKPYIAIDHTNNATANNIYVVWDYGWAYGNNLDIYFARSTDQGESFEPAYIISDLTRPNQLGAMPAVDSNGELYVIWYAGNVYGYRDFYFDKSTDGGQSFYTDNIIITVNSYYSQIGINLIDRIYSFPNIVANPVLSGHLYLTWGNRVDGPDPGSLPDSSDVLFMRSTNYGLTWSSPINVFNNGLNPSLTPNDQLIPWIAVNPTGERISIIYYDRSDFVDNDYMHLKISTSVNDGLSFTSPLRITDIASYPAIPPIGFQNFIGDYNGIAYSSTGLLYPVWADSRNGNWDIYTAPADIRTVSTSVIGDWQTLSVPVVLTNYTKSIVWPTSTSDAFSFCGGPQYVTEDILENGPGYWVKFGTSQTVSYAGGILEQYEIPVCEDWNIVGSITETVPVSTNVCLYPEENEFASPFYIYSNGYRITYHITAGRGHWVKVDMDGSLLVNSEPIHCEYPESISEEGMDHFIITDAEGKNQDLYVANLDLNLTLEDYDLSMPPPIPEVGFDARFAEGEYIKPVSPDSGEIELVINVETQSYPVTLSWELNPENGITYSFIGDSGVGKISDIKSNNGNILINKTNNNKIRLLASAEKISNSVSHPTVYSLMQNYPNPFNPTTMIKYSLPKVSGVTLIIYDILGRKVTTLVNEQRQPGNYEVKWDASNVASGIYFYQLKTKDYVDTKKMILLK